jgi:hypothetical protein
MALAHYTGWSLAEIEDMTTEDLRDWIELLPKQKDG